MLGSKRYKVTLVMVATMALVVGVACSCQKSAPPRPEEPVILMETHGTLSAVHTKLTISADGSIVYVKAEGHRLPQPGSTYTRTTWEGQLSEAELDHLLGLFDKLSFDAEGKYNAHSEIMAYGSDSFSKLSVILGGRTKTIEANYHPFHHFYELPDVPVKEIYGYLKYLVENKTEEVSREEIPI